MQKTCKRKSVEKGFCNGFKCNNLLQKGVAKNETTKPSFYGKYKKLVKEIGVEKRLLK